MCTEQSVKDMIKDTMKGYGLVFVIKSEKNQSHSHGHSQSQKLSMRRGQLFVISC